MGPLACLSPFAIMIVDKGHLLCFVPVLTSCEGGTSKSKKKYFLPCFGWGKREREREIGCALLLTIDI